MSLDQDHKTKYFLDKIDLLIGKGVIKNHAEVVQALNWNKSVMSSVKNGNLPVPQHIYNKFRDVYAEYLNEKPSPNDEGYKDKYIALLERRVNELEGQQSAPPSPGTDIQSHLLKIREDMNYLMSLSIGYSKRALELQAKDNEKFLAEVRSIQQSVLSDPERLLKQGTGGGTDDNSKS